VVKSLGTWPLFVCELFRFTLKSMQKDKVECVMVGLRADGIHIIIWFNDGSKHDELVTWEIFQQMFEYLVHGD